MAVIYKPNGFSDAVKPEDGRHFTLLELQQHVEGYIQTFDTGDQVLVFNEEGLMMGFPFNRVVSELYGINLFGNVLACDKKELD